MKLSDDMLPDAIHRRGFTLVEASISVLIVGTMLVAALNAVGASRTTQLKTQQNRQALLLAEDMMAEIQQLPYEDPGTPDTIGLDSGEGNATRADFDDVDDYHDWDGKPPVERDGSAIPWAEGLKRAVKVIWVSPADPDGASILPTGVKRIQVTIRRDAQVLLKLFSFRTSQWQDPATVQGMGQ